MGIQRKFGKFGKLGALSYSMTNLGLEGAAGSEKVGQGWVRGSWARKGPERRILYAVILAVERNTFVE